jgi:hypothetical protein
MIKKTALWIATAFWTISTVMNPVSGFSQEAAREEASQELSPEAPPEIDQQEIEQSAAQEAARETVDEGKAVYYIRTIDFDITGRTRPFALLHILDLREDLMIAGKAALEALISRKTQDLRNERVLKDEETRIDYTIGEAGEDGLIPVDLLVHTEDSWNVAALPQPRFTSGGGESSGFRVIMKARDYNFLGTMKPLKVDVGFIYDTDKTRSDGTKYKQISVPWAIDADIPFTFLGKIWNFNFDNIFNYQSNDPFQYTNVTGLNVELPWKQTTLTVGFDQSFILNEENGDEEKNKTLTSGKEELFFDEKWYMASKLYARWNVPLGIEVGNFGELIYNVNLSENLRYRPGGNIGEYRRGPTTSFNHNIEFGEIDWIGNFRKGLNVSLNNSITYSSYDKNTGYGAGKEHWGVSFGPTVTGHFLPLSFLGIYGRFNYTKSFSFTNTPVQYWGINAGEYLRGVPDDKLRAEQLFSFNLELPLRILPFNPSQWFESRYFKPFDLEFHFSPFLDLALIDGTDKGGVVDYGFNDLLATAGIEIFAYSLSWRSLYLRGSIGWDLREWHKTGNMPSPEFFFGMERFF